MDRPIGFGFSDHVMNFNPAEQVPEFPAPLGFHHVTFDAHNTFPYTLAPPISYGPAPGASPVPYGFVTNNWMEERQSWFPEGSADPDDDPPPAPVSAGFTVGFENFGDVGDATVHYHHIEDIGGHAPATGDTRGLVRSHTVQLPYWPGAPEHVERRRGSLYDTNHRGRHQDTGRDWRIALQEAPGRQEPEVAAFCEAVCRVRQGYSATDRSSNPGRIWSLAVPVPEEVKDSEVEISVTGDGVNPALHCVRRDSVRVGDFMADVLHQIQAVTAPPSGPLYSLLPAPPPSLYPPLHAPSHDTYTAPPLYPSLRSTSGAEPSTCYLSICGLDEYLQPGHSLRSHRALQRERIIRLRLHLGGDPQQRLERTVEDDEMSLGLGDPPEHNQYWGEMRRRLFVAVAFYEDQVQCFLHNQEVGVGRILESVGEICYLLRSVETQEISDAVRTLSASAVQPPSLNWVQTPQMTDPVLLALVQLSGAISGLLSIYSQSFPTGFVAEVTRTSLQMPPRSEVLQLHLHAAHNLPESWTKSDGVFYVSCSVIYAGRKICPEVKSRSVAAARSFFSRAVWDEMIGFPVPVTSLPYESVLVLRLYTVAPVAPNGSFIAWSCLPLYYNQRMVRGALLLNMISHAEPPPVITPGALDAALPTLTTVQVDFPDFDHIFQRPAAEDSAYDPGGANAAQTLQCLAHRSSVLLLSEVDKQHLWHYRRCPRMPPNILPLILGSAPGWDPQSVSAVYRILDDWTFSGPLEALGLLGPCFPDEKIRAVACRQLERLSDDELLMFLPQLVQALKFEWRLDSALLRLLLHRSLRSIQVTHRMYWLLTDASSDSHFGALYRRLLDAVLHCGGRALRDQLSREKRLLEILQETAQALKGSPEDKRQETLRLGLHSIERFFEEVGDCRLPLNPAAVVKGIDRELCSFFKSNAKPLRISFINADPQGPNLHVMYKTGDDMRQDMLVLQLVELMDRIWLHEGLDLRMISYTCVSTGRRQGLVHLVPDSTTLAKIQTKSGLFGPLKDSSMKKWFHNNQTASDNFLFSCAGWCVVTFLLGVCDRHNDNIMLTSAGHMFHIDFGKFLGNAQMFGKIKRDRAPFIFTTEMESFITQEGRSPQRAQEFVELCCCAYNILRRHSHLIITLMELMLQAGLPELCTVEDLRYVHDRLRPHDSDPEAANYFTSQVQQSLQSPSVKLNFLVHAFANLTPSDLSRAGDSLTPTITKFIRKGARKVQRAGGRILDELSALGDPAGGGSAPSVQLHVLFSAPRLQVLLKHLRNIYSAAAGVTISLRDGAREVSSQRIQAQARTSAPILNHRVQFQVPQLDGFFLRVAVESREAFLGQMLLPLRDARLGEDVWYRVSA